MTSGELVAHTESSTASNQIRVPSVLTSGIMIAALKLSLKVRGYKRTIQWVRRRVERVPVRADVPPTVVKAAEWWVAMAAAFYPGRAQCLERSLVLYYILRRQGVPLKYCHGVQPWPLISHAWVEYRGEVVNDVPERVNEFSRLPDQLP
ncbi:MAG TPA: lasso peptide biosynthesis B2 protein [Gemmatimonadaceae bacterium]